MTYCEDFPCCGHTDGLGCNWTYTPEARAFDQEHVYCDHESGMCEVWEDDEDEDYCDPDTCGEDANYNKAHKMWLCAWCGAEADPPADWNSETERFDYED